ncbi:hypothetical protein K8Z49_03680 [Actinomadura madurae]|uniref:hypothetical protein n=1 Tax=Actinomadura madurae TaxID=1993 RepID=UPI003999DB6F
MDDSRAGTEAPAADAGPVAGERARAAATADPGVPGDRHVAGPAPEAPVTGAPEPVPDTAPDPIPVPGAGRDPVATEFPAPPSAAPSGSPSGTPATLLDPAEGERFRERWREVQSAFVDDPAESVRKADGLASEAVDALGRAIAAHRGALSEALEKGEQADTERLRQALRGYRDLLDRIFAA